MNINIDNISGNSFIDENHDDLLKHLDEITILLQDHFTTSSFKSGVIDFINNIENYFSNEEATLKRVGFDGLDSHITVHRELSKSLRMKNITNFEYDGAVTFLANARSELFSHELLEDQAYWPIFESESLDTEPLIIWSSVYETGNLEIDKHHSALINYVTRFYKRLEKSFDIEFACSELKQLCVYSEFHFFEEEELLGQQLMGSHKSNHETIINDLNSLINEINDGKYQLEKIGDYLIYWLLNHIKIYDIPAFKNNL